MVCRLRAPAAAGALVLALASHVGAQTLPPPLQPLPPAAPSGTVGVAQTTGDLVVEITRQVPFGEAGTTVFTVPSGSSLVVTDVLLTNPGSVAVCGVSIDRGTAATVLGATVTVAQQGPVTVTDSTVTGPLCIAPRTTQQLILTTGMDFTAGQTVRVANAADAALPPGTPAAAVTVHLRGFLTSAASAPTPGTTP